MKEITRLFFTPTETSYCTKTPCPCDEGQFCEWHMPLREPDQFLHEILTLAYIRYLANLCTCTWEDGDEEKCPVHKKGNPYGF